MPDQLFERDITRLRALLDEELAAVAAYVDAIDGSESGYIRLMLTDLAKSHAVRVRLLRERLQALGQPASNRAPPPSPLHRNGEREPSNGNGQARTSQAMLPDAPVVESLLDLEDHLHDKYRLVGAGLSAETRSYLGKRVLTEQRRAHLEARSLIEQLFPAASSMPW